MTDRDHYLLVDDGAERILMPLRNFRPLGALTPEQEEWWAAYKQATESAYIRDIIRNRRPK